MDLETLIAQWSGKLPPGFVPQAVLREKAPRCAQHRCNRPAAASPTGTGTSRASPAWTAEPPVAAEEGAPLLPKAAAEDARTARGSKATSSASGAATTATPSASRSAGTPSTRGRSTSSPPGPTRRASPPTSTAGSRRGTPVRRGNRPQPTGRRCRTRCRRRSANGNAPSTTMAAGSIATNPSLAAGARNAASRFGTFQLPTYTPRMLALS